MTSSTHGPSRNLQVREPQTFLILTLPTLLAGVEFLSVIAAVSTTLPSRSRMRRWLTAVRRLSGDRPVQPHVLNLGVHILQQWRHTSSARRPTVGYAHAWGGSAVTPPPRFSRPRRRPHRPRLPSSILAINPFNPHKRHESVIKNALPVRPSQSASRLPSGTVSHDDPSANIKCWNEEPTRT